MAFVPCVDPDVRVSSDGPFVPGRQTSAAATSWPPPIVGAIALGKVAPRVEMDRRFGWLSLKMTIATDVADNGLTYTRWHTTALCSPIRSCFLTGRNHHLNAMSCITEASNGFPGWSGRVPENCVSIGQMLQGNGYSTYCWAETTTRPNRTSAPAGRSRSSRCRTALTFITASSAVRPTTGIVTWSTTTISSTSPT